MKTHIAFQFGELKLFTESLAAPLFDDVLSRHEQSHDQIYTVAMPVGKRVEITEAFRKAHPDDAKLIDAGNVLMNRAMNGDIEGFQFTPRQAAMNRWASMLHDAAILRNIPLV